MVGDCFSNGSEDHISFQGSSKAELCKVSFQGGRRNPSGTFIFLKTLSLQGVLRHDEYN
jgi:hypothetical protein